MVVLEDLGQDIQKKNSFMLRVKFTWKTSLSQWYTQTEKYKGTNYVSLVSFQVCLFVVVFLFFFDIFFSNKNKYK